MAATTNCGQIITLPFLEGTVPPLDNVHFRGCLDLEAYIAQATPTRPNNWLVAADTWSDRLVNGQTGSRGDPANYQEDLRVQFAITPLFGERGFPSVCGERIARPSPTPGPSGSTAAQPGAERRWRRRRRRWRRWRRRPARPSVTAPAASRRLRPRVTLATPRIGACRARR